MVRCLLLSAICLTCLSQFYVTGISLDDLRWDFLTKVNALRSQNGLSDLQLDGMLNSDAQKYAKRMESTHVFDLDPNYHRPHLIGRHPNGFRSGQALFDFWYKESFGREAFLSSTIKVLGLGLAPGPKTYVCAYFK